MLEVPNLLNAWGASAPSSGNRVEGFVSRSTSSSPEDYTATPWLAMALSTWETTTPRSASRSSTSRKLRSVPHPGL